MGLGAPDGKRGEPAHRTAGWRIPLSACGASGGSVKPSHHFWELFAMVAIGVIVLFIAVIFALNRFEFGRFD